MFPRPSIILHPITFIKRWIVGDLLPLHHLVCPGGAGGDQVEVRVRERRGGYRSVDAVATVRFRPANAGVALAVGRVADAAPVRRHRSCRRVAGRAGRVAPAGLGGVCLLGARLPDRHPAGGLSGSKDGRPVRGGQALTGSARTVDWP